jgi:hypothetical protein
MSYLSLHNKQNSTYFLFLSVLILYLVLQTTLLLSMSHHTFMLPSLFTPFVFSLFLPTPLWKEEKYLYIPELFCVTHFVNIVLFIENLFIFVHKVDFFSRLLIYIKIGLTRQINYHAWRCYNEYWSLCWT